MTIDVQSDTWRVVSEWAASERSRLIERLISANNEEVRGAIKKLDDLLDLTTPRAVIDPPSF